MLTNNFYKLGFAALLTVFMAACSSTSEDTGMTEPEMEPDTSMETTPEPAMPQAMDPDAGLTASEIAARDAALSTTVFYFEFDQSDLSAEARAALVYHANRLKENPGMRIRLEGHADERGTREYNLALGERRAQSVERYLQVQGVSSSQMETISYGEERPVARGTTEAAYARNRRVEIH